jgi:RNA polymerase sigma-70 factor (ECF subfamily)
MNSKQPHTDDIHLIRLAQDGDLNAYNRLLSKYHNKIRQIVIFYVGDDANTNDLVQEVLIKVYRYLNDFKEESEFSTWLYRITQNTVKNYFRSTSLRLDIETRFLNESSLEAYSSPEYQLINSELECLVSSAISQLSEDLRLCYGMHLFEGKTYEDIAHRMSCPIGTVRSRISRARKLVMTYIDHRQH